MSEQNPEIVEKKEADTQQSEVQLSETDKVQAEIDSFKDGKADFEKLSDSARNAILNPSSIQEPDQMELSLADANDIPENIQEDNPKKAEETEIDYVARLKEIEEKHKDLQLKYRQKSDEANTAAQRIESRLKTDEAYRNNLLKKIGLNKKPEMKVIDPSKPNFDPFDENNVKSLFEQTKELAERLRASEERYENIINRQESVAEGENKYSEINKLMEEAKELKTSKNFREIDKTYADVYYSKLDSNGNLTVSDDELKAEVLNAGVPESDYNNAMKIYNLIDRKQYPDLKSAYRSSEYFDDYLTNLNQSQISNTNNALKNQALKIEEQGRRISNEPTTITSTSSASNMDAGGVSNAEIQAFLTKNPDPNDYTPEIRKTWKGYMKKLGIQT